MEPTRSQRRYLVAQHAYASAMSYSPTLEGLSAELKLEVFSYTPIKAQLNCRAASRSFRNFLDDDKNRERLARRRLINRLEYLERVAANVVWAVSALPFLDALKVFVEHRGIHEAEEDRHDDAAAFAARRVAVMQSDRNNVDQIANATNLVQQLIYLHVRNHKPHLLGNIGRFEVDMAHFLELAHLRASNLGMEPEQMQDMVDKIVRTPGGFIRATESYRSRQVDGGFPRIPLTPLHCIGQTGARQARLQGFCSVAELVELLGVPNIGDVGDYCYYTESIWSYHMVQQSLYGRQLTSMEKAAILEEIGIY